MRKLATVLMLLIVAGSPAGAALDVGYVAPGFTLQAALAGKPFRYTLADALAKGPVVLYFFPAAFTQGCSIEAHAFSEATGRFEALGASVIGVSGDDIETLSRFSVQACQGRFPVASDPGMQVVRAYDAVMPARPAYAHRVSYVIAPGGKVVYTYVNPDPSRHVENTLAAVQAWRQRQPGR